MHAPEGGGFPCALASHRAPPAPAGRKFIGQARTLLAQAGEQREAFIAAGIGAGYFEQAEAAVAAYDATSTEADEGREAHVRAAALFRRITSDVLAVVRVLDGLNAARFAELPGERARWESARNVFGPITRGGEVGATPASPEQAIA